MRQDDACQREGGGMVQSAAGEPRQSREQRRPSSSHYSAADVGADLERLNPSYREVYEAPSAASPSLGVRAWKPAGYSSSGAALTFRKNPPSMRLHQVLDNGEAQAGSSLVART